MTATAIDTFPAAPRGRRFGLNSLLSYTRFQTLFVKDTPAMGKNSSNTKKPAKTPAAKPSKSAPKKAEKEVKPATATISKETPPPRVKLGKGGQNVVNLSIAKIKVKEGFNPRQALGDLSALKHQIQLHGVLSSIVACPISEGSDEYWLIAGHRRFAIAQDLKFDVIPATIRTDITISDSDALNMALSENDENGRSNLSALDYAAGVKRLADMNPDTSLRDLAKMMKVSDATIGRALKLLDAPAQIKDMVDAGTLAKGSAVAVVEVDPETREWVASQVKAGFTEGDVKRLALERGRQIEAEKRDRAAKGEPAEETKKDLSRPSSRLKPELIQQRRDKAAASGLVQGGKSWRGPKEMRAQIQITGTEVLNCRDINGIEVPAKRDEHIAQLNRYAALLWADGVIPEIDVADPAIELSLGAIAERAEEAADDAVKKDKPTKDKKADKPKAKDVPKAKVKPIVKVKPDAKPAPKAKPAKATKATKAADKEPEQLNGDTEANEGTSEPAKAKSAAEALGSAEDD